MFDIKPCLMHMIQIMVPYFPDDNASVKNKAQYPGTGVCECGRYCTIAIFSKPKLDPKHQDVWIGERIKSRC